MLAPLATACVRARPIQRWHAVALTSAIVLLELLPVALAHDDKGVEAGTEMKMGIAGSGRLAPASTHSDENPQSYFRLKEHSNVILAHIALMTMVWAFVLPVAVVLNVARSHFRLQAQAVFLVLNAFGVLLGIVYKRQTPDLYEKEKHGPIGWVSTWVASAWVVVSLTTAYADSSRRCWRSRQAVTAVETAMFQHLDDTPSSDRYRSSDDFNEDAEGRCKLLFGQSGSPNPISEHRTLNPEQQCYDQQEVRDDVTGFKKRSFLRRSTIDRFLSRIIDRFSSSKRMLQAISTTKVILDRIMLLFGFLCIATGAVVYGGMFYGDRIFNGLAHFIKGGVFFWYGLLTFGRWMGCFADLGWAWNKRPSKEIVGRWPAMMPSAEFVESAVICFYGASNVWLEHLANPGGEWAAMDLEHVSITLMFFGGGLLGMLIESTIIRDLLATTSILFKYERDRTISTPSVDKRFEKPEQWRVSMNPTPALIISLLGLMMGAHHQASVVSMMLHAQWGNLFIGFSLARIATYALLYVNGPVSYLPQRPPTEIVASFCLIAGGLLLMMSNKDTIEALEYNSLDAMFVFNVTVGFTAFLMAWAAMCLAVKGWAQRRVCVRTAMA